LNERELGEFFELGESLLHEQTAGTQRAQKENNSFPKKKKMAVCT
jgi:hypothetical protein